MSCAAPFRGLEVIGDTPNMCFEWDFLRHGIIESLDSAVHSPADPESAMSIDFGRAPRGDPRMPHVSEKYFGVLFCAGQAVQMLAWARGRVFGLTEVRPRKYDRDLLLAVCKENKQKRQRASGKMPTHRLKAPNVKRGLKHGWGPAWFDQFHYNSWTEKRMGPSY